MVQKEARRPGRPRQFDPDAALLSAMKQFWDKGFAATSLDDLSAAMQLNRPSLYGAFGDKRALYLAALERYRAGSRRALKEALSYALPLREDLARVYATALKTYLDRDGQGCFVISTATAEATGDAPSRLALAATLADVDLAFEARIAAGIAQGETAGRTDAQALAKLASAMLYSLAIRARAGESEGLLEVGVQAVLDAICGPKSGTEQQP